MLHTRLHLHGRAKLGNLKKPCIFGNGVPFDSKLHSVPEVPSVPEDEQGNARNM
jgi:hypothetical protein